MLGGAASETRFTNIWQHGGAERNREPSLPTDSTSTTCTRDKHPSPRVLARAPPKTPRLCRWVNGGSLNMCGGVGDMCWRWQAHFDLSRVIHVLLQPADPGHRSDAAERGIVSTTVPNAYAVNGSHGARICVSGLLRTCTGRTATDLAAKCCQTFRGKTEGRGSTGRGNTASR